MQLLATQGDEGAVVMAEAGGKESSSPRSASEGEAPASPSSPSSPSKGGGPAREKPVKVLPCPRCESMNTKFCYYNNYSVTQPRHFCRQCQRYWTAGGTLRNVPVGGGSRKKNRHPRAGEPYLHRPFGTSAPPPPSPSPSPSPTNFQHMLTHDMISFPYNPSPFPTFAPPPPPIPDLPPHMHAMYGTGPPPPLPLPLPFYEMPAPPEPVKPEFWTTPQQPNIPKPRFESSMLLNLGLTNRDQSKPAAPKNGSPPHGSSTIEEEGSTPTNGYSNNGYEETDTVSSMWHSLHDDTMFQDSMFQLNGDDRC